MDKDDPNEILKKIDEINQEKKLFKSIADYSYDWAYFIDLNGIIAYVSPSCERITGFYPHDFLENNNLLKSIIHEDDKSHLSNHLKEELKFENISSFEFRIISKDGKEHCIEHYCQPAYDDEGKLIGRRATNRDITEKKKIQDEISRINSLNQSILNVSLLGIVVYEYSGNCIFVNNVAAEKIGATVEQCLKQNFRLIDSWQKSGLLEIALKALESKLTQKFELKVKTTFEKDVWLDCSLIPFVSNFKEYLMIVFDDISERKNIELQLKKSNDELEYKVRERTNELENLNSQLNEELKKSIKIGKETIKEKEFLNSLLDTAGSIVLVLDKNANIILFNHYAEIITGYKKEEILGKNWFDVFIPKNNLKNIKYVFEDVLKEMPDYSHNENRICIKNGNEILIDWSNTVVKNDKGESLGVLSIGIDITQIKEIEEKYKSLYNSMNEGMALHEIVYDNNGKPIDYILLDINPQFEKITGLKKENVIGNRATRVYGVDEAPYLDIYSKVAITGNPTRFEITFTPMGKSFNISVFSPEKDKFATVFEDITERKKAEESLKKIEWLLTKEAKLEITNKDDAQPYGNLLELNTNRLILDSVGEDVLSAIAGDYIDLLETSSAIYEENGDYAFGIFSSGWCKLLDKASRDLCGTLDNKEALESGKWHCHESCWAKASKVAIETGKSSEIECSGGINLYTVPIFARNRAIGSINFGYGDPPKEYDKLVEISNLYQLNIEDLINEANKYETRPKFIIDLAKNRLQTSAKLIGEIVERKLAEEELIESETTLRAIFETAPIGICLLKDRRFQWINHRMSEILGYTEKELIGQKTRILYDTEDEYERVGKLLYHSEKNTNFVEVESILKKKDGTLINCYTSVSPLDPSDYSKGFITTLMDITDRKNMEREIIKLAKFPSENPNPIIRVSSDGVLLYANTSSSELLSFWKIGTGKKLPNYIINSINEALLSKKQIKKDIVINDKIFSLTFVPLLNESYINIYGKDTTEEKNSEMALRESEEKHRSLFETMVQGVVYEDTEGIIISANQSAEKILGLTFDQMTGRTSSDPRWKSIHEDGSDFPGETHPISISLKTGKVVNNVIMGVFNPQCGDYRWININSVPLFKKNEKRPYLVYTTFEDITERKKAEVEILKYQNHLEDLVAERTTKLETINKELEAFSYSVSHDLRAPLRAIDGFGQALVEEYGEILGEEGRHYIKRIRNATIKMGNLIDDMLKLSRISRTTLKKEKVNLSNLVEDIINELKKSESKRKVKITIQKGVIVNGDSSLMRIMLENLLSNAWKFTSKQDETIVEFGIILKEEKDIYYIKDNGVGFNMEYADKLFTPFHRLHSEEEFAGTGVGLANVKRIINMHGGNIWAEGKIGEGATFYFII